MAAIFNKLKKNISMAKKSVFANWREYACFFVALTLVQILFGVSALTYCNNNRIEKDFAEENYDYHFSLKDLSTAQFYYLCNVQASEQEKNWIFDLSYTEYTTGSGNARYDAFITLRGDVESNYEEFLLRYGETLEAEGPLSLSETALLTYEGSIRENRALYIGMTMLSAGLSFLVVTILYRIKVDHFKFTYGIYLSFGADFKRLLSMAASEMLIITVLTFLPSTLLSYSIAAIIYAGRGGLRSFYILPLFVLFIGSVLVSLCSVIAPVLGLAMGRPMKWLIAEDNSHLVSSPRHSAAVSQKKLPLSLELLSVRRYRRYFAKLIASVAAFGMLFVSGVYLANCTIVAEDTPLPQYTLDFTASKYSADSAMSYLQEIEGVRTVIRDVQTSAFAVSSNVLVPKDTVTSSAGFTAYPRNSAYVGSMMLNYHCADTDTLKALEDFYGYSYEGDLSKIAEDDSYVVISDSLDNLKVTSLKPGDKILIAVECRAFALVQTETEQFGFTVSLDGNGLLASYFDSCDYTYQEFTVAAVIQDAPSGESMDLYLSPAAYTDVTHRSASAQKAQVYLDPTLDPEAISKVELSLRALGEACPGMTFTDTGAAERVQIAEEKHSYGLYLTVAVLALLVCPLIFFFSLILFYKKRHLELDILRAVGAVEKELRGLFLVDGVTAALLSGIAYSLLSLFGIGLCQYVINRSWFSYLIGETPGQFRYTFDLPVWAFVIGLLLTILSAFGASIVAYLLYRKRTGDHISESFTEGAN